MLLILFLHDRHLIDERVEILTLHACGHAAEPPADLCTDSAEPHRWRSYELRIACRLRGVHSHQRTGDIAALRYTAQDWRYSGARQSMQGRRAGDAVVSPKGVSFRQPPTSRGDAEGRSTICSGLRETVTGDLECVHVIASPSLGERHVQSLSVACVRECNLRPKERHALDLPRRVR